MADARRARRPRHVIGLWDTAFEIDEGSYVLRMDMFDAAGAPLGTIEYPDHGGNGIKHASLAAGLHRVFGTMAEVLEEFSDVLIDEHGVRYHAHVCGAEMPDGKWQGWLEFMPLDGAAAIRSGRETTQPNRKDMLYWATGLTPVYLEGALERALKPVVVRTVTRDEPAFEGPAPIVLDSVDEKRRYAASQSIDGAVSEAARHQHRRVGPQR